MTAKYQKDEFKYDTDIQKSRKERAAFLSMIRESLKHIKDELKAKTSSKKNLSSFYLYKSLPTKYVEDAFTGKWNERPIYISVICYYTSVQLPRIRSAGYDYYLVGHITLNSKYPHTLIQPEIMKLKLENLITKRDVDFSNARLFSFLFYVMTKDKFLLKLMMKDKDLNKINKFMDAEIEIIGTQCYFRVSRKAISVKEVKKFVKLGKVLDEVL